MSKIEFKLFEKKSDCSDDNSIFKIVLNALNWSKFHYFTVPLLLYSFFASAISFFF